GTALRALILQVLTATDAGDASTQLFDLDSAEAIDALIAGEIDVAMFASQLDPSVSALILGPLLQNCPVRGEGGFGCACRISGTGLPIPACLREKYFFWAVPESKISRRIGGERPAPAPESGPFALRVLGTLPQAHQRFVFDEICGLCRHAHRTMGVCCQFCC